MCPSLNLISVLVGQALLAVAQIMFDGLVEKFAFPKPETSYTEEYPLRIYTIDGYYNEIKPLGDISPSIINQHMCPARFYHIWAAVRCAV